MTKTALLREAKALEDLGADWEIQHVAAFCGVSVSYVYRATNLERIERAGGRGVKGKPMLYFNPAVVRAWNAARTLNAKVA